MRIRLATLDDLPAICDISNDAALRTIANFADRPEPLEQWRAFFERTSATHPWLVCVEPGASLEPLCPPEQAEAGFEWTDLVGFAKASPWIGRCAYDFAVETTVYVRRGRHGGGRGRALMAALLDLIARQGYRVAIAGISQPNEPSVRLHEAMGFRRVGTFHAVGWKFGAWRDVGYWQCRLEREQGTSGTRPPTNGSPPPPEGPIRPVAAIAGEADSIDS